MPPAPRRPPLLVLAAAAAEAVAAVGVCLWLGTALDGRAGIAPWGFFGGLAAGLIAAGVRLGAAVRIVAETENNP